MQFQQVSNPTTPSTTSIRKPFTPISPSNQIQLETINYNSFKPTKSETFKMVSPSKNLDKHHKVNEVQEKIKMQRNGVQALQAQRQEEEQRKEREKEKERERKRREKAKEEKDKEDVEMGGIYSLSDKQLGDRWNFEEEIGFGNWGSVWRCQQLQSSNSRSASSSSPSRSSEQTVAKLCHRQRSGPSQARVRSLWNEFKVLRGVASSVRTETRKRNGRNGEGDESYDASSLSRKANGNGNGIGRGEEQDWHPNIVRFQEFIISPSYAFLFMPYYPQPMNVALPEHIYRDYFQGLASGLFWLHSHNCTHNDIKTANILVSPSSGTEYGVPILVDFGFAVLHSGNVSGTANFGAGGGSQASSKRTASTNEDGSKKDVDPRNLKPFFSNTSWGTPEYLAPERAKGDVHDERISDAWSLGITFFEIATGRTPFESESEQFLTPEALQVYYQRTVRSEWQGTWDTISQELVDLVRGLLEVSPKDRMTLPDAMLSPFFDPLLEKEEADKSLGRLLGGECSLEREIGELQEEDEQERRDNGRGQDRDGSISRMSHRSQERESRSRSSSSQKEICHPSDHPRDSSPGWSSLVDAQRQGTDSMDTDLMEGSPWKNGNVSNSHSYPRLEATEVSRLSMEGDVSALSLGKGVVSSAKPHPYHPRRSSPLKAGLQPSDSYEEIQDDENESNPSELSTPSVTPIEIPQHSSPAPKVVLKGNASLLNQKSPPGTSQSSVPRTPPTKKDARPLSEGKSPRPRSPTVHATSPIVEIVSSTSTSHNGNKTPLRSALRNAAFAAARKLSPSFRQEPRSPISGTVDTENQLLASPSPVRTRRGPQAAAPPSSKVVVKKGLVTPQASPSSSTQNESRSRVEVPTAASLAKRFDAPSAAVNPSRSEDRQIATNESPNSTRKRTARGVRDAVRSAERRAVSPPTSQARVRGNTTAPPNYDELQRPHSLETQSSQREESGSEPVSIPERNQMEDSLTFDSDDDGESSDEGDSTVENEEDDNPTARQTTQVQTNDSELQPVYLHPPRQTSDDQIRSTQPRRMSSQFGITNPSFNVKRKEVDSSLAASLEESPSRPEMSGWGMEERRAQQQQESNEEVQSPDRSSRRITAQSHRRTQTAPSEISIGSMDGAEFETRLLQMAELAKTLTRCVEETRQSFREAGVANPAQVLEAHDDLQAQVQAARDLLSRATPNRAQEAPSRRTPRSQRAEHSHETSSSQLSHSESVGSFSSNDRQVVFKDRIEQFSPASTPALSSVNSHGKQQSSFAFPTVPTSASTSTSRDQQYSRTALKVPTKNWTSEHNSYEEGLQGYNSDSHYDSSNHHSRFMTSSQTDVSVPAPSLTSASSFEDSQQHPSASFASSRIRAQREPLKKQDFHYPSKIPILSERKRPKSGAFSYNATPSKRINTSEEDDEADDLVFVPSCRIPTSNRSSYIYTKSRNQAQDNLSEISSKSSQKNESKSSRNLLGGGSVRREGKGFTARPTVATSKESASSSNLRENKVDTQAKFSTVGSKANVNPSKNNLSRSTSLGRGSKFMSKKSNPNLSEHYQPSTTQVQGGKSPATPARGGALWRLLRGVGVKSKEMQRTV